MNIFAIAWVLLLVFAFVNNYIVYRMLTQRGRMDLMWISLVGALVPIVLFAIWPGGYTLLSFPLITSLAMFVILRILQSR